jgi:methionyl-tRNA synthetase
MTGTSAAGEILAGRRGHIIGKDIIRFHAVYWPAFLMSAGCRCRSASMPMASCSTRARRCRSRSATSSIRSTLVDHFGLDQIRYFCLREVSFGQDGKLQRGGDRRTRINSDLANGIGNLAQPLAVDDRQELRRQDPANCGPLTDADKALIASMPTRCWPSTREDMGKQLIHRALAAIIAVVSETDRYFAAKEPWALKKTDPARMATVLYVTADVVRQIAHPAAALHAGVLGEAARPAAPTDKRRFRSAGRGGRLESRNAAGSAEAGLPALCRADRPRGRFSMLIDTPLPPGLCRLRGGA